MTRASKPCVDCVREGVTTKRKTPHPGPRCTSHHRLVKKARSQGTWEARILATYGITAEEYWAIHAAQGGRCAICGKGTGATKRLSIDHDHESGIVRGLLDSNCNVHVLGHLRDSREALQRAIDYLDSPPAVAVIGERVAPVEQKRRTA